MATVQPPATASALAGPALPHLGILGTHLEVAAARAKSGTGPAYEAQLAAGIDRAVQILNAPRAAAGHEAVAIDAVLRSEPIHFRLRGKFGWSAALQEITLGPHRHVTPLGPDNDGMRFPIGSRRMNALLAALPPLLRASAALSTGLHELGLLTTHGTEDVRCRWLLMFRPMPDVFSARACNGLLRVCVCVWLLCACVGVWCVACGVPVLRCSWFTDALGYLSVPWLVRPTLARATATLPAVRPRR